MYNNITEFLRLSSCGCNALEEVVVHPGLEVGVAPGGRVVGCNGLIADNMAIMNRIIEASTLTKAEMATMALALMACMYFAPSIEFTGAAIAVLTFIGLVIEKRESVMSAIFSSIAYLKTLDFKLTKAEMVILASAFITYVVLVPSFAFTLGSIAAPALVLEMTGDPESIIQMMAAYTATCVGIGATVTDMSLFWEVLLRILTACVTYCALGILPHMINKII